MALRMGLRTAAEGLTFVVRPFSAQGATARLAARLPPAAPAERPPVDLNAVAARFLDDVRQGAPPSGADWSKIAWCLWTASPAIAQHDQALGALLDRVVQTVHMERKRPFRQLADSLAVDEEDIVDRLQYLIARGVITRFGCVVRHRKLGYTANAMAVWDIPDDSVDAVAARFASNPQVTLCYRRPRRLPDWRYNLFCMVHAKTRHDAYAVIDDLNLVGETGLNEQAVLFSTRCFKQRGALFSQSRGGLH